MHFLSAARDPSTIILMSHKIISCKLSIIQSKISSVDLTKEGRKKGRDQGRKEGREGKKGSGEEGRKGSGKEYEAGMRKEERNERKKE